MACHARLKRETWSILPSPSDSFESHGSTAPSLSKKNRNSSKLEIPVLIKASTTTGSRLKFVPSAFRESSILDDSLGTKLRELAMLSRGSLPTRLSQSCPLGGVPLLLHNDYGRDEPGDGGEGRKRDRPNDVLSDMLLRLGQLSRHLCPTCLGATPPSQEPLTWHVGLPQAIASIFEVHLDGCAKRPLLFWPLWRCEQRGVSS